MLSSIKVFSSTMKLCHAHDRLSQIVVHSHSKDLKTPAYQRDLHIAIVKREPTIKFDGRSVGVEVLNNKVIEKTQKMVKCI